MAFDASRHERCPQSIGPIFFQFGVAWFWVALAVEGRASEAWRELRAQDAPAGRLKLAAVWAHCTQELREALLKGSKWSLPLVPAWSLPDSRRIRGLGLGSMWAVVCPYCSEFHTHSPGPGRRTAHCCAHKDGRHYVIEFAGALPLDHQDRFCTWVKTDLPRLVHTWAEADEALNRRPAEPLAA
jgi:hypothetical protein